MNKKVTKADRIRSMVFTLVFIILCAAVLYSFLIVLGSSLSSQRDLKQYGFRAIPHALSLEAYKRIFSDLKTILQAYGITILTTVVGTLLGVAFTASIGYVISRDDYPYRRGLGFFCYFTMLFSGGLVPTYMLVVNWLGLKNSIWAIILPGCVSVWNIMLMKSYFKSLPTSLIEAAKIDGLSEIGIFFKIVIPLSKPAIATIALFFALSFWNQWYNSMLYTDTRELVSLQYMLMKIMKSLEFLNSDAARLGMVITDPNIPSQNARMAMCIVAAGPILVVFPFFQKYFVKGINVGAMKG